MVRYSRIKREFGLALTDVLMDSLESQTNLERLHQLIRRAHASKNSKEIQQVLQNIVLDYPKIYGWAKRNLRVSATWKEAELVFSDIVSNLERYFEETQLLYVSIG